MRRIICEAGEARESSIRVLGVLWPSWNFIFIDEFIWDDAIVRKSDQRMDLISKAHNIFGSLEYDKLFDTSEDKQFFGTLAHFEETKYDWVSDGERF